MKLIITRETHLIMAILGLVVKISILYRLESPPTKDNLGLIEPVELSLRLFSATYPASLLFREVCQKHPQKT